MLDYEERASCVGVFYTENTYTYAQYNISVCILHIHIVFTDDKSSFIEKDIVLSVVSSSLQNSVAERLKFIDIQ